MYELLVSQHPGFFNRFLNDNIMTLEQSWPFILISAAILADYCLVIPKHISLSFLMRQTAIQLSYKAHPSSTRAPEQQHISGMMAVLFMVVLWLFVPTVFYLFVDLKIAFSALILWLILGAQPWFQDATLIRHALDRQQKELARQRLSIWLNRDVEQLSEFGLLKATNEHSVIRLLQAWFGVLFWFALAGPLAALGYRLVFEMHRAWPSHFQPWRYFGMAASRIFILLNWLPHQVITLSFVFLSLLQPHKRMSLFAYFRMPDQQAQYFYALSQFTHIELGGPMRYQNTTYRFPRFKPLQEQAKTTPLAIKDLQWALMRQQCLLTLFAFIIYSLRLQLF